MCIGGHYTMDRFDAVVAAELVGADQVIPCHYDTFPPIETDAQAFKSDVQNAGYAEVVVLAAGRDAHAMTTAVVLIEAERDAMSTLGGALADLDGVAEAYSVTGEWDFVAIVRVPRHEMLADVVTGRAGQAPRRQPHPDDGRLRGLLAPRPRGDVLDRLAGDAGSSQPARTPPPEVHQQAVVPGAVGAELVVAHAPDGLEADRRVGADRALVVRRRGRW